MYVITESIEEITDPTNGYYQKKVVREGPGFMEVMIMSGGGNGNESNIGLGDIL